MRPDERRDGSLRRLALLVIPMILTTRLLMSSTGAGTFSPTATGLPADGSWSARSVVISPTQAWEETSVQEIVVLPFGSGWIAWAKGGWASGGALGFYTSPDGSTWTHYASNPVLGRGGSGVAVTNSQPEIIYHGGLLYLSVHEAADVGGNAPYVYVSADDGFTWTIANGGAAYLSGAMASWGNRTVWIEGSTWYQIIEAAPASTWQMYLASSTDGLSWSFLNFGNPLTSLQPVGGYSYGGPMLATGAAIGGAYHLYYHSGSGSTSNIYHATSTDKITWTIVNGGGPIMTHSGWSPETDQIADPTIRLSGGTWYMWVDAVDNAANTGRIELATAPAT